MFLIRSFETSYASGPILARSHSATPCRVSILILIFLMTILYPRCTLTGVSCTHLLHRSHITRLLAIPPFQQFHPPELPEATMAPPLSYYLPLYFPPGMDGYGYIPYDPPIDVAVDDAGIAGEPHDPVDDFDGLFVPQRDAVVPMGEDQWEEEELSAGLRDATLGDRSEVSTEQFVLIEPGDGLTMLHCILCFMRDIMLRVSMWVRMAAHRRNARRVSVDSDPPTDTAAFMAAMNSMATAMRDSAAAIRESAAATNRAMEHMGRRNRNNGD
ncbi:hypothetical protein PIB30_109368, partial [Stylosanthes scabra]|nr:hypothetical protein [Stylosanthes scabra]